MSDRLTPASGLDAFWLQADTEECPDHPLERELCFRLDALERYRRMIADAQAIGRDDMADALLAQHDREAKLVRKLEAALRAHLRPDRSTT
jgi:hypothetical protein